MTREEARQWFLKVYSEIKGQGYVDENEEAYELAIKALEQESTVTTTSTDEPMVIQYPQVDGITPTVVKAEQEPTIEAYKQVCKERDIAIEQLHELGYELGQKIEPCDDVVSRQAVLEIIKLHTLTDDYLAIQQLPPVSPARKAGSCEDAISRQAAIDAIVNTPSEVQNKDIPLTNQYDGATYRQIEILGILEALPSVSPARPKGKWFIDERPESDREVICSNCEQPIFKFHKLDFDYRPCFCPNCGADMRGDNNEND